MKVNEWCCSPNDREHNERKEMDEDYKEVQPYAYLGKKKK